MYKTFALLIYLSLITCPVVEPMKKICMKNFSTDHIYILLHLLYFILLCFIIFGLLRGVKTTVELFNY